MGMGTRPPYMPDDIGYYQDVNSCRMSICPVPMSHGLLSNDQNGQILFTGSGDAMRDLLSVFLKLTCVNEKPVPARLHFLVP